MASAFVVEIIGFTLMIEVYADSTQESALFEIASMHTGVDMAKLIMPKNTLKKKVGDGGFKQEDLMKAQRAIDDNDVDFRPIADKYLTLIHQAIAEYNNDKSIDLHSLLLDQLMQLRAQGSLFRYSSISAISDTVVDLLDTIKKVDATIIEIVEAYEKSTKVLLLKGVRNSEDMICKAFVTELSNVCKKYKDRQVT
jgi:hypothetical protein